MSAIYKSIDLDNSSFSWEGKALAQRINSLLFI